MPNALPPLVLLAAGKSSRTSTPKGLFEVDGRPWIEQQLRAFAKAGGRSAIVVLGYHAEAFWKAVPCLKKGGLDTLRLGTVINPDPKCGPFSSIQVALAVTEGPVFILPIDVPAAGPEVWHGLAKALGGAPFAQPVVESKGGHPVLLGAELVRELRRQPATSRLDAALQGRERARFSTPDSKVLANLNTPAEWAEFLNKSKL